MSGRKDNPFAGNIHIRSVGFKIYDPTKNLAVNAGSTSMEAMMRKIPQTSVTLNTITIDPTIIQLKYLVDSATRATTRGGFLGLTIAEIISIPMNTANWEAKMGCKVLQVLTYLVSQEDIINQAEYNEALKERGINIEWERITQDRLRELIRTPIFDRFRKLIGVSKAAQFLESVPSQLIPIAIFCLLTVKQVTADNRAGWLEKRISAFCGVLGVDDSKCVWTPATMPSLDVMRGVYRFLSSAHNMRKLILNICIYLSSTPRYGPLFSEIINLMKGAEMGQFLSVDTILCERYPELLCMRILRAHLPAYNAAYSIYQSWPAESRLFAKILYPKEKTAPLSRINYLPLCRAATAAARHDYPTMRNYQGGAQSEVSGEIETFVTSYLNFRLDISMQEMIISHPAAIHPLILNNYKNFENSYYGNSLPRSENLLTVSAAIENQRSDQEDGNQGRANDLNLD